MPLIEVILFKTPSNRWSVRFIYFGEQWPTDNARWVYWWTTELQRKIRQSITSFQVPLSGIADSPFSDSLASAAIKGVVFDVQNHKPQRKIDKMKSIAFYFVATFAGALGNVHIFLIFAIFLVKFIDSIVFTSNSWAVIQQRRRCWIQLGAARSNRRR